MFKFTFTNRAQYLQQKKEWISAYEDAVKAIRHAKERIKVENRNNSLEIYSAYSVKSKANKHLDELIEVRRLSREEANRQWLASRNQS